jgi:hypothetical protein
MLSVDTDVFVTGSVNESGFVTIVFIVDNDLRSFSKIDEFNADSIAFNFSIGDWPIVAGSHIFDFYAVDADGAVTPPVSFTADVIRPTATGSATPAVSETERAWPTQTPAPAIALDVVRTLGTFDIVGFDGDTSVLTSWMGYSAVLRIGDRLAIAGSGPDEPARIGGVSLSVSSVALSSNAASVTFSVRNEGRVSERVDVGIGVDLHFDSAIRQTVTALPNGRGFVVSSSRYALSFVLRSSPLVSDVSTFYFGSPIGTSLTSLWTQSEDDVVSLEDPRAAFSWQGITVDAGKFTSLTSIVQFGLPGAAPSLTLFFPSGTINIGATLTVPAYVTTSTAGPLQLILVVDSESVFRMREVSANENFEFTLRPAEYGVGPGYHQFMFYVADSEGNLSPGRGNLLTLVGDLPARTRSPSPTPSQTPIANVSIGFTNATDLSFDIIGMDGNRTIHTAGRVPVTGTAGAVGYVAALRVGNTTSAIRSGEPVTVGNVTLSVNSTRATSNALWLILSAANNGSSPQTCDVLVWADVNLDGADDAPVSRTSFGFSIVTGPLSLSFATGGYPGVTDVSSFWFGSYFDLPEAGWTQVIASSFSGSDSAIAFSWRRITLQPGEDAERRVLVRFGEFVTRKFSECPPINEPDGDSRQSRSPGRVCDRDWAGECLGNVYVHVHP